MLIRFVVENVYSFGNKAEFTTIPNGRLKTLNHHKYNFDGFDILKLTSIYGANGAGKSNLIKSLELLQTIVIEEEIPFNLKNSSYKFNAEHKKPQQLVVEFIQDSIPFYYGIELLDDLIMTEELYISGLGRKEDELIYERKSTDKEVTIRFSEEFENDEKSQVLKSVLIEDFIKPNQPILKLISKRDNKFLQNVKKAFKWFSESLQIITPDSKPGAMAHRIDTNSEFKKYAIDTMRSLNIGITDLLTEKKEIKEFFSGENEKFVDQLVKQVLDSPKKMIGLNSAAGDELVIIEENGEIWVKQLKIGHKGGVDATTFFELDEESDGTIRLLDFVPAFNDILSKDKVYVIDEVERSIHPLLIKELIKKYSLDDATRGQLIFTTHESNLLDQDIFRLDEIWFAEKDFTGSTDIYSLSDFKEHKTIDIRKGYLNGRYGSIPFLGNLQDLNWHEYAIDQ